MFLVKEFKSINTLVFIEDTTAIDFPFLYIQTEGVECTFNLLNQQWCTDFNHLEGYKRRKLLYWIKNNFYQLFLTWNELSKNKKNKIIGLYKND